MEYRRYNNRIVLRLDAGDEIIQSILSISKVEGIRLASVTGIGGTDYASIGVFDIAKKAYTSIQ